MAHEPAERHPELPAGLESLLQSWLPEQRWFPAKGKQFRLVGAGLAELPSEQGLRLQQWLLAITPLGPDGVGVADTQLVQVPLVLAGSGSTSDPGYIATLDGQLLFDGPRHPAYVAALLDLLSVSGQVEGSLALTGHQVSGASHQPSAAARVLSGEQSNTSIIVSSAQPLMVKLFRVVSAGPNPDVQVTSALTEAGVGAVARVAGWVAGSWRTPSGDLADGHLAVSAEFVSDGQDAWREAIESASDGTDFTSAAAGLGAATARVHLALADRLGSHPASESDVASLVTQLRGRVSWALAEVPQLAEWADQLAAHSAALGELTPAEVGRLQRVHGDYHLGQVLHSPSRGWILLDFEGEPLRPLAERTLPDCPVRDVAGMLRSFDYAAGYVAVHEPEKTAAVQGWASRSRAAFLDGYRTANGPAVAQAGHPLFDALLLDKALYEAVYEARNRPEWLAIPLRAVEEIIG